METTGLAHEPIPTPAFDDLVRELDELLLRAPEPEAQPAIEELFLARMADARPARRPARRRRAGKAGRGGAGGPERTDGGTSG